MFRRRNDSCPISEAPRRGLSIRARLILLALLAIVPLTIDRVRLLENSRSERVELAHADVIDLTRRAADAQNDSINSTRAILQMVARGYVGMREEGHGCALFIDRYASDVPWIKGFLVIGADGKVVCSTRIGMIGADFSDRPYVRQAQRDGTFVLSDYVLDDADEPAVIAAYPARGKDEAASAIILATVDLRWVNRLADVMERRPGASAVLLDGRGTVVAAVPDRDHLTGHSFAAHPLVRELLSRTEGSFIANGFDGVRRLIAFARLPGTDSRVVVALDEREILSRIDRETGIAYLQLGLFGLLTLLAAWFGGEQLIVEPIRSLARVASRIGHGELAARPSAQQKWAAEFAPLAAALTDMAAKLAAREHELRTANRHLQELASLDSLSGLPNRRSFDARLETEWQRAHEHGRPIGLMMVDVDHFKLFNDSYGHLEGDRCLQLIGEVLNMTVPSKSDFAARYGGEEFALLLPDSSLRHALNTAEQLRASVAELRIVNSAAPCGHITISIGVACMVPKDENVPQHLIESADSALYEAKRRGRNMVVVESPALVPELT